MPSTTNPITQCPSCRGSGVAQYGYDDSGNPCGPVYDCDTCDGTGETCDYDALCWGCECGVPRVGAQHEEPTEMPGVVYVYPCTARDTIPAPGPHECETLPPPAGEECA